MATMCSSRSRETQHVQLLESVGALGEHEMTRERVDVLEADVGPVGDDGLPMVPSGRRDGRNPQLEVLCAAGVREDVEPVAVCRARVVLDVVLDALVARRNE